MPDKAEDEEQIDLLYREKPIPLVEDEVCGANKVKRIDLSELISMKSNDIPSDELLLYPLQPTPGTKQVKLLSEIHDIETRLRDEFNQVKSDGKIYVAGEIGDAGLSFLSESEKLLVIDEKVFSSKREGNENQRTDIAKLEVR